MIIIQFIIRYHP